MTTTRSANMLETIDADVHLVVPSIDVLLPYLDDYWRTAISETSFKGPVDSSYPRGASTSGGTNGQMLGEPLTDLGQVQSTVLGPGKASAAILTCAYAIESIRNPYAAAAVARAVNDWQIEHWLDPEPRLRGSVVVPVQDPELARIEIERVGGHPGFVQVHLPVHSEALYGTRRYYPIYDAAVGNDLALGIAFGGNPGNPPTAVGWPSFYIEEYVGMSHIFQSQLISLVTGGIFDQYPTLRVALIESGVTWLPSLMWRLDKEWKGLRREVPWVRRLPSEYIREHVRLTTWPFDTPASGDHVQEIIEQLGSDDLLMYSSDFPHRHDDRAEDDFLADLPEELTRKIRSDNARAFYRLS